MPLTILAAKEVASFTDAWIETPINKSRFWICESHLLQMRGLKPFTRTGMITINVASFTDAWIETINDFRNVNAYQSHLLQMRGLKHRTITLNGVRQRRIFYRCVD